MVKKIGALVQTRIYKTISTYNAVQASERIAAFVVNARAEGFKAGQEAMRERAAKLCDDYGEPAYGGAILALPIEEEA